MVRTTVFISCWRIQWSLSPTGVIWFLLLPEKICLLSFVVYQIDFIQMHSLIGFGLLGFLIVPSCMQLIENGDLSTSLVLKRSVTNDLKKRALLFCFLIKLNLKLLITWFPYRTSNQTSSVKITGSQAIKHKFFYTRDLCSSAQKTNSFSKKWNSDKPFVADWVTDSFIHQWIL